MVFQNMVTYMRREITVYHQRNLMFSGYMSTTIRCAMSRVNEIYALPKYVLVPVCIFQYGSAYILLTF